MKRKPMLFQRLKGRNREGGREVIGLIGTHKGVGVTHTALMLAFYMSDERCKRTALLECNKHHDFELIQEAYEWRREEPPTFSFHNITCYKEVTPEQIPRILGEDYECFILDFGEDLDCSKEEFLRCTTKMVIGGASEWDFLKLKRFVKTSETLRGSTNWLYFIPQANDKRITRIKSEIQRKVWSVPWIEEPTLPNQTTCRFFSKILS